MYSVPPYKIKATLRGCMMGEINNTETKHCEVCPLNFYSFDVDDKECTPCPIKKMICLGGAETKVKPDYWRPNITTDYIIPCRLKGVCVGEIE